MRVGSFLGNGIVWMGVLSFVTVPGCGSGSVCDIDFGSIAGTYTFVWKMHDVRYRNSCFERYEDPQPPDPAKLIDCTWNESTKDETLTVELVVDDSGDIGSAQIRSAEGDGADDVKNIGVKCEMLERQLCDAPVRCSIISRKCGLNPDATEPDAWKFECSCEDGSSNDPTGKACQACKASYEKYQAERMDLCAKGTDGDYIEFALHVEE